MEVIHGITIIIRLVIKIQRGIIQLLHVDRATLTGIIIRQDQRIVQQEIIIIQEIKVAHHLIIQVPPMVDIAAEEEVQVEEEDNY